MKKFIFVALLGALSLPVSANVVDVSAWRASLDPSFEFSCRKKKCKDMKSCEEACYQYTKCGRRSLDRDKDKIPCENVCGKHGNPCKL